MKHLLIILSFFFLLSCSQEPDNGQTQAKSAADKTENTKQDHPLSEHEKALQKAKEVEKELKKADNKRRKVLNDNG